MAASRKPLETLASASRPELRWMVNPYDYVRPVVYDITDARWKRTEIGRQEGRCP